MNTTETALKELTCLYEVSSILMNVTGLATKKWTIR